MAVIKEFGKDFKSARADLSTLVYGKIPPQAPDMESAVLGAMMLEKEAQEICFEILPFPECFYVDAHQKIFKAAKGLGLRGMPIDLLTLTDELRRLGELEIIGGAHYLMQLTFGVVTGAHIEAHCRIVMEKYMQRELIRISGETINQAYEDSSDVFELIENVQSDVNDLTLKNIKKDFIPISNVVKDVQSEMEVQRNQKHDFTGVPTGMESIDRLTRGWQKTDLIILAARPAVGKTAFILNLAYNAAVSPIKSCPVGIFSLEMGRGQLIKRIISRVSNIELDKILNPKQMMAEEYNLAVKFGNEVANCPIVIDDTAGLSIFELRSKARRMVKKNGVELIIVDYLQLMKAHAGFKGNREQEISMISREMKILAKELEIPIIALSQLNRGVESRQDNKPKLSDLRESGAIEQDADIVCFLYRPTPGEIAQDASLANMAYVDFQKHRNGGLEKIPLSFYGQYQLWEEQKKFEPYQFDNPRAGFQNRREPFKDEAPF